MTSLRTRINRIVGPILANCYTGIVAVKLLRDRIPHRGLTIDTGDPVVTPEIKAALLLGGYESGENRFVQRRLPRDIDVVELGGRLGVISYGSGNTEHGTHEQLVATPLDSGRFRLFDSHGPVVAPQPVTPHG